MIALVAVAMGKAFSRPSPF